MSERGSFVTEYVYCHKCFDLLKEALIKDDKFLKGVVIPFWGDESRELPIIAGKFGVIAGKIGGLSVGDEIAEMREVIGSVEARLCHPVRVAVLADSGKSEVIVFNGDNDERR